ncbi:MAG: hypothetical protein AABW51_01855 [Nanoarchaeota archaeon]
MERKTFMWIVIGGLFLVVLFLTFKVSTISAEGSGNEKIDTSGWTENEKMNYEMHGVVPAKAQGSAPSTSAGAGMVGGC